MTYYWTLDYLKHMFSGQSELVANVLDSRLPNRKRLPCSGQTVALARRSLMKTSALCYDRVWALPCADVPEDIRCFGDTPFEREFLLSLIALADHSIPSISHYLFDIRNLEEGGENTPSPGFYGYVSIDLHQKLPSPYLDRLQNEGLSEFVHFFARSAAKEFSERLGITLTPLLADRGLYNAQYSQGDRRAIVMVLENISVVDEDQLTWAQVEQYRADSEARAKYRRLLHWLDKEMVGKTQSYIEDEIAIKMDEYERSLKKHGIKTVTGTVSEILDGKYLAGLSVVATAVGIAGYPILGALAATGILVGRATVKVVEAKLKFSDIECGTNSEIAWLYELERDVTSDKNSEA